MNQLQYETSPYLLQHQHNPVHWYAWKPEAFERAKAEQKPILVSIGYSTCHWCHVMEHESFENDDIAAFMNAQFICIKVDREERPDVDAIYMEACQAITGGGGWPLNCFLTPECKPFYAGTYFPPRPAYNRPSWLQLLQQISNIWETKRETAYEQADRLINTIVRNDQVFIKLSQDSELKSGDVKGIFERMRDQFDLSEGGFGGAPKFPSTMAIRYLLDYFHYYKQPEALQHAELSLKKMIGGGIYDQIGGGFARYATDREWLIPHFEKMLYDNALLVSVMSDYLIYTGSDDRMIKTAIEETLDFVAREMTHKDGGFYAAYDADSEGVEGKFYVWQKTEIEAILGDDAPLFCEVFDVTTEGNWEETNILWQPLVLETFARQHDISLANLLATLEVCKQKLLDVRSQRIWPGLDDKIITGWNALMVSGYCRAFTALGHESYRQAAVANMEGIARHHALQLWHTRKGEQVQYMAFLDDYAFLIAALIDLYECTFDPAYLSRAEGYAALVIQYFTDEATGLFFYTDSRQVDVILRKKDLYDNATPSGNSTMVHNLKRLSSLLYKPEWAEKANQMLQNMQDSIEKYPLSFERWASALLYRNHPEAEIAIVGSDAMAVALSIQSKGLYNCVIAASVDSDEAIPLLAGKTSGENGEIRIYLCHNYACQAPVDSEGAFWEIFY